ncbi:MAG: hypothetical protein LBJ97_02405 [Mycoplasmataceae bacterium]|nr:hypothetical protein [Mycoplasmataceae bacterium]
MIKHWKKIILLPLSVGIISGAILISATACGNDQTETTYMIKLYKDRIGKENTITGKDDYYEHWNQLVNDNTNRSKEKLTWCLEYSSFAYFLFQDGLTLMDGDTSATSIRLKSEQNLWNLIDSKNLVPTFNTNSVYVEKNSSIDNELLLSYIGYLHLTVQNDFTIQQKSGSDGDWIDFPLNTGNVIEILLCYKNLAFNLDTIEGSTNPGEYFSQNISPTMGDGLGSIMIYQNGPIGYTHIPSINAMTTVPDFFEG